jgi:hypothetical protein
MTGPTEPTEPIPSGRTEPLPTPERRPSLVRRAWLAWAVAALVLLGGVGVAIFLTADRSDLREELATTEARLRQTQRRITRLSQTLERAVGRSVGLSRGVDTCIGALDDQVDLFNALARELNAARALNESQAESFHRRAVELRRTANRSLARCRSAGAGG